MFGLYACRRKIVSIYAQTIHIGGKLEASIVPCLTLECYDGVFQSVPTKAASLSSTSRVASEQVLSLCLCEAAPFLALELG